MYRSPTACMLNKAQELVKALENPDLYKHPVSAISIIETHISWVILTGVYAYKIKKPVDFGFIDFTTLDKRKFYCDEELRLNRRYAPDLYLETVAIRGSHSQPRLHGDGEIIEYAVKMREFSQHCLLSNFAAEKRLLASHIDAMAQVIAEFHAALPKATDDSPFGSAETIAKWSNENFQHIESALPASELADNFDNLKTWCRLTLERLGPVSQLRRRDGFVRECHGDLHLGNIAFLDNQCTPFDCIEFNDELRWIDTISEVAFVVMDLQARGYTEFAWRFLNHYLAISGDYTGLALLPYYVVYRALVRAKVEALRAVNDETEQAIKQSRHYLDLAQSWSRSGQPAIFTMHGLSGSGKSTVAENLAATLGAIQVRSDIERKRLFKADKGSESTVGKGIYNKDASEQTYQHLARLAENLLDNGFKVIIDAACLKDWQRQLFKQTASKFNLPGFLIHCQAPESELLRRIEKRFEQGKDASEANRDVLLNQIENQEPLSKNELESRNTIICDQPQLSTEQIAKISAGIGQQAL